MAAAAKPSKKEGKKYILTKTSFTSPFPPPRRHAFNPEHKERGYTDKNQEEKQWENQEENQEEKNQEENQENV
ncbi:Myelin basic protein [Dissostichus eleginoides]|uniref:Myelin basic protein n=1 Tax=Dissostichus eleginoides TaxID=100907 RepID=A0AAD9FFX9_DISEL|nr:Myelin basic protein [Dissostichus eleginoides]